MPIFNLGQSGLDTFDATATASDILSGKTAYVSNELVTGSIPNRGQLTQDISTKGQTVSLQSGYYSGGTVKISGTEQSKIIPANIKTGVSILGQTGTFTADATSTASDILSSKTAYVNGQKLTGSMPNNGALSEEISTVNQSVQIPLGYYSGGSVQIAQAEQNKLMPSNIKTGVTILGVLGNCPSVSINVERYSDDFPVFAAENTIGVISATAINGYIISSSIPTTGLVNGLLWIKQGPTSPTPVPLTDIQNIFIYPISTQQYINGAWVPISGKVYKNGSWVSWVKILYEFGTYYEQFAKNGNTSDEDQYIQLSKNASGYAGSICTTNLIDITDYKTLYIDQMLLASTSGNGTMTFGLNSLSNDSSSANPSIAYGTTIKGAPLERRIDQFDISEYSGSYGIKIFKQGTGSGNYNGVFRIWLEG